MDSLNFNSVVTLPNLSAQAAFQVNSSAVFKEDVDIVPVIIDDTLSYVPWGGDNNMPFDILKLIEDDETLSTCQMFNAEVCIRMSYRSTKHRSRYELFGNTGFEKSMCHKKR